MPKTIVEFEIVKLVRNKRTISKLSQAKIAEVLMVTAGYIGQVEMQSTSSMYSYDQLNQLAKFFECSPKDFMPEKALED